MTVKDLIEELQKFNPDQEIRFTCAIESDQVDDLNNYSGFIALQADGDYDISIEDGDRIERQILLEMGYEEDIDKDDLDQDQIQEVEKSIRNYKPKVVFNISGEITNDEYDEDFD